MKAYTKFKQQRWTGRDEESAPFERHSYDDCMFYACHFSNCRWTHSKFFRVSFVANSRFSGCIFKECRFWGQHSYLGPSIFEDCVFQNCEIKDVSFGQAAFLRCRFPGSQLDNVKFCGSPADCGVTLTDVDFSQTTMTFVGFELGIDLSSVQLPADGLRVFKNHNNELGMKLVTASGVQEDIVDYNVRFAQCPHRALLLLGGSPADLGGVTDRSLFKIQNPLVFSVSLLENILQAPDERRIFEELVKSYEIRQ